MKIKSQTSYPERPERSMKKNTIYLSRPHLDTFKMGELVPVLYDEVIPGDHYSVATDCFFRFPPMYLPIMNQVMYNISYFYVPYRILWPGRYQDSWEWFIRTDQSVEGPYVNIPVSSLVDTWEATTVAEHLGIPSCQTSLDVSIDNLKVVAYPFSAILMIWDEYFRNDQIQGPRWFELQGGDNTTGILAAFPQYDPGVGATQKLLCLKRNWPRDLFTSCTPTPQIGANTLVPIMRNDSVDEGTWSYLGPTMWRRISDDGHPITGKINWNDTLERTVDDGGNTIYLDIQETSASIRDLRYAIMVTEFLEKDVRLGDKYRDYVKGRWNVDPFPLLVDRPAYFGGDTGTVIVSEVMTHAETINSDDAVVMPVGAYTGQMLVRGGTKHFDFHCMEHGLIIGLLCVYPHTYYFQGLHKKWTRFNNRFDFPFDEFAFIGDEVIKHKELMFSYLDADQNWNDGGFGYNRRYYDWVWANATISGKMRDSQGPLFSFHFGRFFDVNDTTEAALNSDFLECKPDTQRVFIVDNEREEEVYAYLWHDVKVHRQIAKYATPGI